MLDSAFRVPGTNIRFGWDPIIGLVPWAGDVAAALLACALIAQAHRMRVPRVVQLRMLINVAIDILLGLIPIVGDAADVFWKANTRNLALVERFAAGPQVARAGDWLFVASLILAVLVLAILPLVALYEILHLAGRAIL